MQVGLFIPCYVDQFYPNVAKACLNILEKLGCEVDYPLNQTCCGQPMANAGFETTGLKTMQLFVQNFKDVDYIVAPSGSCVLHVKEHFRHFPQTDKVKHVRSKIFELCEFLTDIVPLEKMEGSFPYRVGLHSSCHGQRGLRLNSSTELHEQSYNKTRALLEKISDLQIVELTRKDECCGFGGTFSVSEEALSVKMGEDRIKDHTTHGAEVITSGDMSCLMHLEGLLKRQKSNIQVLHVAEILNSSV